jgi:hypothetical protein
MKINKTNINKSTTLKQNSQTKGAFTPGVTNSKVESPNTMLAI